MAQRTQVVFTDDLDGTDAVGTVHFALDGKSYEIDLNEKHAKQLRDGLAKYIDAGRKVSGARRGGRGAARGGAGPTPSEVREWAKNKGYEVSERGRVPNELIEKYLAAGRS